MEITGQIQSYDWGKKGSSSKVAFLVKADNIDFIIDENTPYAELWMGTHVNAPSIVKKTGKSLATFLEENSALLGEKVANTFNMKLPFLLKILSINKALSIQAHPSKKHAEELHSKRPDIYRDSNHKPELAIALTPFEALCGFRPIEEIKTFMKNIPELHEITKCDDETDDTEFLKRCFKAILTCDKEIITNTINSLITKFENLEENERNLYLAELIERLNSQFPNDNGVLMIYLLNYIKLKPSESLYLGANEVHAYIYGDCVEIMASSDNVVRAGLTSKLIDVETLCSMLKYKGEKPEDKIFHSIKEDDYTNLFKPPVPDFAIAEIKVPGITKIYKTIKRESASIIIVINGCGRSKNLEFKPGSIIFLAAHEVLQITDICSESILMYQGFANIF